ncbi:MAG: hypothetical protein ACK5HL_00880 [Bacilli bacterium]
MTKITKENTNNAAALFAGTKTLSMRTAGNWINSTNYTGSWYLPINDYSNK